MKTIIRASSTHTGGTEPAGKGEAADVLHPNNPSADRWNYNIHIEIFYIGHTNQLDDPLPTEKCK